MWTRDWRFIQLSAVTNCNLIRNKVLNSIGRENKNGGHTRKKEKEVWDDVKLLFFLCVLYLNKKSKRKE
jgi:hypothetical protein